MSWKWIIGSVCMGLAACSQPATQDASPLQKEIVVTQKDDAEVRKRLHLQPVKWPLRFNGHTFIGVCYSTLKCSIWYNRFDHGERDPSPPSSEFDPKYLDHIRGGHSIDNFPAPAEVEWRSADGADHKAKIDIASIFRDGLIRHNVPREEIADEPHGEIPLDPDILLEVNSRTIRVYMRAHISTRELQKPGNPYSNFRDELVLVKTYNY